jgi:hypothetical protein
MASGRRRQTGKLGDADHPKTGKLVSTRLKTAPPGRYGDGGGLWLQVMTLPDGGCGCSRSTRSTLNLCCKY